MRKMLRKIGIRQKIIFGVGLLVMFALFFQGGILWYFVQKEIKKNVTEKLLRETRKKAGLLNDTMTLIREDMEIMQAHKSIEDYFTSYAFEDGDGMTDAVAGIEPFFSRIYKAKPQYARMQMTTAQGSGVLQIVNGKRIEKHDQHDIVLAIEKTSTGEIMHNAVGNDETGWIIQSVSALVFENKTEGLLWLSLSVDKLLNKKILEDLTASGVTCVISDQDKKPVAHSRDIAEDLISGFINKDLPDWLLDSKKIENLGWNIHLGLEKDKAYSVLKTVAIFGIIVLFTSLTMVIILVWFLIRIMVLKHLTVVTNTADRLANFDLTAGIDLDREDEIGKLLKAVSNMLESLRQIISMISEGVIRISSSAGQLSGVVADQAAVAAQQSASVSEISSTMEEFSASSNQIASNSNSVVKTASNTLKTAQNGVESIETAMEKMDKINEDNLSNARQIADLRKKADEITKVMGIINNIADQTKLIAFNAALEASSAGEAGKRFGVVAAEIRRLADSVMDSTNEIETKINEIQEASNYMGVASETSSKGIRDGLESFSQTASLLHEILAGAQSTTNAAKQISLSTQQQKTATDQVVIALEDIAEGAQHISSSINEISSISNNLKELSDNLQGVMKKFVLE